MNRYTKYISLLLVLLYLTACSTDFLDEVPDNRTTLDSSEKIRELLVNAYPNALYVQFTELMSDNAGDKGSGRSADDISKDAYYWSEYFQNVSTDSPEYFWTDAYSSIAVANQALKSLEELDQNDPEIQALKAEARITRAYAHFMLVNLWAKSFDPVTASADLGIPIATEPENVVYKDYERASVQEVYDFIEKEIEESIGDIDDSRINPAAIKYHFNKDAAHAFATRFYLFKGEWEKVLEHADKVLRSGNIQARLVNWNGARAFMTYQELQNNYTSPTNPWNLLVTEAPSWWGRTYAGDRYGLTIDKVYELIWRPHPTGGDLAYGLYGQPGVYNIPKYVENFIPSTPGGNSGYGYLQFALFRLEEVLLSRAEANVMLNNYPQAMADLNLYYSTRITGYNSEEHYVDLNDLKSFYERNPTMLDEIDPYYVVPAEGEYILQALLDARQSDYYHEGFRWFDIRRFHIPIIHYTGNSDRLEEQEPMELPGNSPLHQLQIPSNAASFLEPNPR